MFSCLFHSNGFFTVKREGKSRNTNGNGDATSGKSLSDLPDDVPKMNGNEKSLSDLHTDRNGETTSRKSLSDLPDDVPKTNGNEDTTSRKGLSDLRDDVLHYILKKLQTKDAAKMSILSKNFEELWASIDVLKISQNQFKKRPLFLNFVDRELFTRGRSFIKAFHLSCDVLSNAFQVDVWIFAVMKASVEVLSLSLQRLESPYSLPHCLFHSHSLTTFRLDMPCILNLPLSITSPFPSLKILCLRHVTFADAYGTEWLLSSLPLEELSLFKCVWPVGSTTILTPKLQRLSIAEFAYSDQFKSSKSRTHINIICTCLKSFYFKGGLPAASFSIHCSSSLEKAEIHFPDPIIDHSRCKHIIKILNGLARVKDLSLLGYFLQAVGCNGKRPVYDLPVFDNLNKLKLDTVCTYLDGGALLLLLSKFPHLTVLELVNHLESPEDSDNDELVLDTVLPCFHSHIEKIICSYSFLDSSVVGSLLKANEILEELINQWPCSCAEKNKLKEEAHQQLQKLLNSYLQV